MFPSVGTFMCFPHNVSLVRPEIFVWPKKKIVVEGGNTSMHCYASGVPRPIVTWIYHKGPKTKESVTSDNTTSNSTLLVIMTQNSDLYEGNYTCNASSIVGMETKTAEIVVDGKFQLGVSHSCTTH